MLAFYARLLVIMALLRKHHTGVEPILTGSGAVKVLNGDYGHDVNDYDIIVPLKGAKVNRKRVMPKMIGGFTRQTSNGDEASCKYVGMIDGARVEFDLIVVEIARRPMTTNLTIEGEDVQVVHPDVLLDWYRNDLDDFDRESKRDADVAKIDALEKVVATSRVNIFTLDATDADAMATDATGTDATATDATVTVTSLARRLF